MAVVWGVHAVVAADAHSMTEAVTRATRVAQTEGFAQHGDEIVVAAGVPFGHSGTHQLAARGNGPVALEAQG